MSIEFEYVRRYYEVPACIGRRVSVGGRNGTIVDELGAYIGVNFDDENPTSVLPCHPTSEVEYLEMGTPRKITRSQKRYRDYLKAADCFPDGFGEYIRQLRKDHD